MPRTNADGLFLLIIAGIQVFLHSIIHGGHKVMANAQCSLQAAAHEELH